MLDTLHKIVTNAMKFCNVVEPYKEASEETTCAYYSKIKNYISNYNMVYNPKNAQDSCAVHHRVKTVMRIETNTMNTSIKYLPNYYDLCVCFNKLAQL